MISLMAYQHYLFLSYPERSPFFCDIAAQVERLLHLDHSSVESIEYLGILFVRMEDER